MISYHDAIEEYFAENEFDFSPTTTRTYRIAAARFHEVVGAHACLSQANVKSVRKFRDNMISAGLSIHTVRQRLTGLRTILKWLSEEHSEYKNPFPRVRIPTKPQLQPKAISETDLSELRKAFAQYNGNKPHLAKLHIARNQFMLEFFVSTGARLSETINLKWCDLRVDEATILGKGRGGGKKRVVFLNEKAQHYLKIWRAIAPQSEYVFVAIDGNDPGQQMSVSGTRSLFVRKGLAAGCTGPHSPQTIRHRFAIRLLLAGAGIELVSKLLGHATIAVTFEHYSVFYSAQLKSVHSQYNAIL